MLTGKSAAVFTAFPNCPLAHPPEDRHNTVEVIRVPAGELTGSFVVRVKATAVVAKAVPWLDGGGSSPNQDFALYVFNANQVQ